MTAGAALRIEGVTVEFGGVRALHDVTVQAGAGEVLGFIGPNGAGKTTLFDVVSGFIAPDSGRIFLGTDEVTALPAEARATLGLGRSFQDARLFPSLTVKENLALAFERQVRFSGLGAVTLGLTVQRREEQALTRRAEDLIELLGLPAFRDKFVYELSTGSRRVVDMAMVLAHGPRVLLLDEPSSGIAQRETEALGPLILRIREQLGCTVLVIEHDMPLITAISDRIVALEVGEVIAAGAAAEVMSNPRVIEAYLGGGAAVKRSTPRTPRGRPSAAVDTAPAAAPLTVKAPAPTAPAGSRRGGPSWAHRVGVGAAALVIGGAIYLARSVPPPVAESAPLLVAPSAAASPSPSATALASPSPVPEPLLLPPNPYPAGAFPLPPAESSPTPVASAPASPSPASASPSSSPTPTPSGDPLAQVCSILPSPAPVCPSPTP